MILLIQLPLWFDGLKVNTIVTSCTWIYAGQLSLEKPQWTMDLSGGWWLWHTNFPGVSNSSHSSHSESTKVYCCSKKLLFRHDFFFTKANQKAVPAYSVFKIKIKGAGLTAQECHLDTSHLVCAVYLSKYNILHQR